MVRSDSTVSDTRDCAPSEPELAIGVTCISADRAFYPFSSGRVTLGRGPDCDLALPGARVSRHHATITREGRFWVLTDNSSKNGTFHNGHRVTRAPLGTQDVVRVGEWVLVVTRYSRAWSELANPVRELAPGVWGSERLHRVLGSVLQAACSEANLVVSGETGTGKEIVARLVHEASGRKGPLISINCAALPETIAEAELFGYRKGAFSGAEQDNKGFMRDSAGGTLFLDEVTELARPIQAKLLRALEQRAVVPLGEARERPIDLRVVCATQEPLERVVASGRFRSDLMARLCGVELELPPMRERREDVLAMFRHYLRLHGHPARALHPELTERLANYDWPLNAREVVQAVRHVVVRHGTESLLKIEHLPQRIADFERSSTANARRASESHPPGEPPEEHAFERLIAALRETGGNVKAAAQRVGISRPRAYRLMRREGGIDIDEFREPQR